ncbi:MAG TPA: hypothetical protein VK913_01820, partial [Erythrobacter sp.]|nr:hypothetical protein [Erythrobacter sp.]
MFFTRHRLALRITRRIGLSRRSRETAAIVRVIVNSASRIEAEAQSMTEVAPALGKYRKPKKWFAVLRAAAVLNRRPGPIEWLSQELAIPRSEAGRMLQLVSQAAQELLGEYQGKPVSAFGRPQHPTWPHTAAAYLPAGTSPTLYHHSVTSPATAGEPIRPPDHLTGNLQSPPER